MLTHLFDERLLTNGFTRFDNSKFINAPENPELCLLINKKLS